MPYLVIARPEPQQANIDWIQNYRSQHDRQFSLVEPHFTIVFAIQNLDRDGFLAEVKKEAADIKSFDFELKVATINQDDSGNYYHEFLVPDTGYSNIVKLHDKMYSGTFAPYLRFDVDFIPHISIGDSEDSQVSKQRIDSLNTQGVLIHGHISSLDVIEYADGAVTTLEKIQLKPKD